jgi:hypothetical protein
MPKIHENGFAQFRFSTPFLYRLTGGFHKKRSLFPFFNITGLFAIRTYLFTLTE